MPATIISCVDADRLAELLADRLIAIVPPGFHVEAADGMLWYSADQGRFPGQQGDYRVGQAGTHIRANLAARDGTNPGNPAGDARNPVTDAGPVDADSLVGVAVQALDELQNYISEATHDPWPGTSSQPRPHARIRNSMLHLFYGDPDHPVLACPPIPIAALERPRRNQ